MEAPLGASALMHSSTLVISGVILILKLSIIIELSVYSQLFMYIMGIFSALMGSFIACFQFELKMILAYSTISNMGYIFILLSVGAYYESTVVILLHAFIKIYMFLIVGNIIYNNNGCQDIR
jgi:NADH:ubiquinone oxidoreductase subunit 5 (chain L)/Multisubunit Na+/H+ antiporter, MnhA subunit